MAEDNNRTSLMILLVLWLLPVWFFLCLDVWLRIRGPEVVARLMYQTMHVPAYKVK